MELGDIFIDFLKQFFRNRSISAYGFDGCQGLCHTACIFQYSGTNLFGSNVDHSLCFNINLFDICFIIDFRTGMEFQTAQYMMTFKKTDGFICNQCRNRINGVADIRQTSAGSFLFPFFGITIAVKNNPFMGNICVTNQIVYCFVKVFCFFQLIRKFLQCIRYDGIEYKVRAGNRAGRRRHTEFEFIPCKRQRRSSVSVCGISVQVRQCVYTYAHFTTLQTAGCFPMFNLVENILKLIPKENGNDGRRRFRRTQTMIIAMAGSRHTQNIRILIHTFDDGCQENQELCVFVRCFTRIQQVLSIIGTHRPVVVFTAAVDTGKGFFMEQTSQTMVAGNTFHSLHNQLVMVCCCIAVAENRRQFMLCRRYFIMLCFCGNTQFPQFHIQFMHKTGNSFFDAAEIMVIQFLTFWRRCTKQCSACKDQVFSLIIQFTVNEEILLFCAGIYADLFGCCVAEQTQDTHSLVADCFHGTQQRCLFIQRFPCIGAKRCGDV